MQTLSSHCSQSVFPVFCEPCGLSELIIIEPEMCIISRLEPPVGGRICRSSLVVHYDLCDLKFMMCRARAPQPAKSHEKGRKC